VILAVMVSELKVGVVLMHGLQIGISVVCIVRTLGFMHNVCEIWEVRKA